MLRKSIYIGVMIALFINWIVNSITGHDEAAKAFTVAICAVTFVFWTPEEKRPPVKGTIQFDKRNYDVPAMRIVFNEDPLNIINYDEVIFNVERDVDLRELDESK